MSAGPDAIEVFDCVSLVAVDVAPSELTPAPLVVWFVELVSEALVEPLVVALDATLVVVEGRLVVAFDALVALEPEVVALELFGVLSEVDVVLPDAAAIPSSSGVD